MKRLLVILLFLLLGAIVNVAVAWGCAIFVNINLNPGSGMVDSDFALSSETGACWALGREDSLGSTILFGFAILEDDRSSPMHIIREYLSSGVDIPQIPAWSQFANPPTRNLILREISRGWPNRTLYWVEMDTSETASLQITTTRQRVWVVRGKPNEIILPLAPIWTGFAINTIFYAALLWLLIPGTFVLRRLIRLNRGLCVKCAYDLRGAEHEACPECGAEVARACNDSGSS